MKFKIAGLLLLLSVIAAGAALPPIQYTPFTTNLPSGATNVVISIVSSSSSRSAVFVNQQLLTPFGTFGGPFQYVATNGNDSSSGWTIDAPVATPYKAALNATNGTTIFIAPGSYSIGTKIVAIPNNVNMVGESYLSVNIIGYADCSGPENGLSNTGGPQIHPGNNSIIEGFSVTCDTNAIAGMSDLGGGGNAATHTGSWSGIGVSHLNPPAHTPFTNVIVRGVKVRNGLPWDCIHINSDVYCGMDVQDSVMEIDGGSAFNSAADVISSAEQSTRFVVKRTALIVHTNSPLGNTITANGNGGTFTANTPCFWSGSSRISFEDCTGVSVANAKLDGSGNGGSAWSLSTAGGAAPKVYVFGGTYTNGSLSDASGFYQAQIYGWCNYFNTNTWSTAAKVFANGAPVLTNFTTYAAGTAYTLTASSAALTFGTTQPVLTINQAGTYKITGKVGIKYSGATYAGAQTITLKFRRTNNTAADLTNGSRAVELPVLTTFTGGDVMPLPDIVYTAASGDTVTIFGILTATPTAGSVQADSAELMAIRLY